ncbi:MAG: sulfurtransferase TusA family protein [Gammaproteobacteria bacterium]|nr:sulfurtransferase TusA family protein [Gammaproteobacteria bacterium]MCW8841134.1 sulfurtransferase TusA family protein [Gammaproteobacteria bacterium]MCW8928180.1 sulfurtransferase TusA family protein [Gammaproteobacteria bacterium]MCW8959361.1 sulfurtransferase TusA family protein [Gammaproteobacteria bacterium]MCW8973530.1 sulfurtransferase TusA family protein [Gammaproteobacteria bacterium]
MFLRHIFGNKDTTPTRKRQRVCTEVTEQRELPGFGTVAVRCRVSCVGEGCPKPQLMTLKALDENQDGDIIEVVTDNLSAVETIPSMMDIYGGQHMATVREEDCWRIYVRRENENRTR